jgi:hypothetical protein
MTGENLYNYILQVLKRTDKSDEVYTAIADTVMDMRTRMLSDEHSSVSTTPTGSLSVGDYKLALPSDFGHLIGDVMIRDDAADQSYYPLKKISKQEYDKIYHDALNDTVGNRGTGVPIHFCYYGQEIYLGPPVDKTTYEFSINYTLEDTPTYTSATASIPFTDQFREVVRAGVLFRMFRELELYDSSAYWQQVYDQGVQTIINNDDFNTDGSTMPIQYHGI